MALAILEADLKRESIARLPADERLWRGTRRSSWPAFAGFNAWTSIVRWQAEVDFIGRLAMERRVGTMLVIPIKVGCKFPAKRCSALRHENPARNFILHRSDKAFNHGDASMLPNRPVPRTNCLTLAPSLEVLAPEDAVLVADQILGRRINASGCLTDESANRERIWPPGKNSDSHGPS